MLVQPWPPPAPGPGQPRDAHGAAWTNDVARAPVRPGRTVPAVDAVTPAVHPGTEPRTRRGSDAPPRDVRTADLPEPDAPARPRRLPVRWVPQEEWIPDPTPAPEQRWTPEHDWVGLFAARDAAPGADQPVGTPPGADRRRVLVLVAAVAVVPLALAAALVAALVTGLT